MFRTANELSVVHLLNTSYTELLETKNSYVASYKINKYWSRTCFRFEVQMSMTRDRSGM